MVIVTVDKINLIAERVSFWQHFGLDPKIKHFHNFRKSLEKQVG